VKTILKVSEIQARAADLIAKRGLCKKTFVHNEDTSDLATCPLCVLAAFNAAVGASVLGNLTVEAERAARAFADWLGIDPDTWLIEALGNQWNDRPEQTQANVVRQLRRCSTELARAGQ
jgi:hypothetical protein